ncbi:hypothetical protein GOP47_0004687 [Adiantum capillus-veneris]|uniref:Sulfite oxidase n=1 Tax=Adiantum capillus-veneris TaxID=13818 RepID=A0A9D4ZN17_ADICA|nr:hypothetical protein GOP47_0004687 [Adiantum capillus-veneris]
MEPLHGPATYEHEPPRHWALKINSKEPFNAEPPACELVDSYITSVDMFYKRNHGPIPVLENYSLFRLKVGGLAPNHCSLSMDEIKQLPKHTVVATLQCAGNRRTAMSLSRKVKGVGWDISALGNGVWSGARLSDVLNMVGIPNYTKVSSCGGKHVEFVSVDKCKEENGGPYKGSIPLLQATSPDADVILAYEMNGEELNRDHGYPLRVVVPGVIGARSVKWLKSIDIIAEECQGFFMQKDYKMFPPSVTWDNINWGSRRPLMDFPIQCAICRPEDGAYLEEGSKVTVQGYALSGGGRGIERIDVSVDGGKTWIEAKLGQGLKSGHGYIPDDDDHRDKWAWVLWELSVQISSPTDILAKAVDSAANVQPESVESIWNLRGVLNNSWHKVHVNIIPKQLHSNL